MRFNIPTMIVLSAALMACDQQGAPGPADVAPADTPATPAPYDLSQLDETVRAAAQAGRDAREECFGVTTNVNSYRAQFPGSIGYTENRDSRGVWTGCTAFIFESGDRHIGIWGENGTRSFGVYEFADGSRYEGSFANILANGYDMERDGPGVLWDAAGQVRQQGVWAAGQIAPSTATP